MAKLPSRKRGEAVSGKAKTRAPRHPDRTKNASKRLKTLSRAKSKLKNSKIGQKFGAAKSKVQTERSKHIHLHRTFRRSYHEDYARETRTPGLLAHAMLTYREIFRHWKVFGRLLILMVVLFILAVGLMSEEFYQQFQDVIDETGAELANGESSNFLKASMLLISTITSGGLDTGMGDVQTVFMVILFLMIWLVTIFLLRHFMAGESPSLRDGLYNALGPLVSTLLVFVLIFVQAIPIMLVIITYSAAVMTDFLATPFYALVYFLFAAVMLLLSGYMLSSSIIALVSTTAPGIYPVSAVLQASDLMAGRRIKFVIRLIYLIIVTILLYIIVMLPVILLDMRFKSMWSWIESWPIVPFFLLVVTCFAMIYLTTYIYLYYRWLLEQEDE